MKLNLMLLSFILISSISYGDVPTHNRHYLPVEEIYVDKLPESIMDLQFIHSISKMPIVFRGAAKHWEAMNWTPESLEARGLKGVVDVMSSQSETKTAYEQHIYFEENTGKRVILSNDRYGLNKNLRNDVIKKLLKDTHYYEINFCKDINEKDRSLLMEDPRINRGCGRYSYYIFAGRKFCHHFHEHETALLAEFYGKKLVLLAQPGTKSENLIDCNDNDNVLTESALAEESDLLFKNKSKDYAPFQKVILNPGDILYIPAGWKHEVHYLTPCLGITQLLSYDTCNHRGIGC